MKTECLFLTDLTDTHATLYRLCNDEELIQVEKYLWLPPQGAQIKPSEEAEAMSAEEASDRVAIVTFDGVDLIAPDPGSLPAEFKQEAVEQALGKRLPNPQDHQFAYLDRSSGLPLTEWDPQKALVLAVAKDLESKATDLLGQRSLQVNQIVPSVIPAAGCGMALAKSRKASVVVLDLARNSARLLGITAAGVQASAHIEAGFEEILGQVKNELNLRFEGSALKLFFDGIYDFSEKKGKLLEPLAEQLKPGLATLKDQGFEGTLLTANYLPETKSYLVEALASQLGLEPFAPAREQLESDLALKVSGQDDLELGWRHAPALRAGQEVLRGPANRPWIIDLKALPEAPKAASAKAKAAPKEKPAPKKAAKAEPEKPKFTPAKKKKKALKPASTAPAASAAPAPAPKREEVREAPAKDTRPARTPPPPAHTIPEEAEEPGLLKKHGVKIGIAAAVLIILLGLVVMMGGGDENPPAPTMASSTSIAEQPDEALPAVVEPEEAAPKAADVEEPAEPVAAVQKEIVSKSAEPAEATEESAPPPEDNELLAGIQDEEKVVPAEPAEPEAEPAPVPVVEEPLTGTLAIASEPAGAAVFVNGQEMGRAPVVLDNLEAREHEVKVTMNGHNSSSRLIEVKAGETLDTEPFVLEPKTALATVETNPEGVPFFIEPIDSSIEIIDAGQMVNTTPANIDQLLPGKYRATFTRNGWPVVRKEITVEPGEDEVEISHRYRGGTVRILSNPNGAEVYDENGILLGRTPLILRDLPPAERTFVAKLEGREDVDLTTKVEGDATATLAATMLDVDRIMRADELEVLPKAVNEIRPMRPYNIRNLTGEVVVRVLLEKDGKPSNPQIVASDSPDLEALVMADVKNWRFTPAMRKGRPVRTRVDVPIVFTDDPHAQVIAAPEAITAGAPEPNANTN